MNFNLSQILSEFALYWIEKYPNVQLNRIQTDKDLPFLTPIGASQVHHLISSEEV